MTNCYCGLKPIVSLTVLCGILALSGCGGGAEKVATAPVSGTITQDGAPVSGGSLTFLPIAAKEGGKPGKSATAAVGSDGTYKLTTYDEGDGAAVGKHQVIYSPPAAEVATTEEGSPETAHDEKAAAKASITYVTDPAEVEVSSGSNTLDFKLVPSK